MVETLHLAGASPTDPLYRTRNQGRVHTQRTFYVEDELGFIDGHPDDIGFWAEDVETGQEGFLLST